VLAWPTYEWALSISNGGQPAETADVEETGDDIRMRAANPAGKTIVSN